jgi:hypothetical protein
MFILRIRDLWTSKTCECLQSLLPDLDKRSGRNGKAVRLLISSLIGLWKNYLTRLSELVNGAVH